MQIANSLLKNIEVSSTNNVRINGSFEKLLISGVEGSHAEQDANAFDDKFSLLDGSKNLENFSRELIGQPLTSKSIIQSNNGAEASELYDQKFYALGKLSYVEKDQKIFSNIKINSNEKILFCDVNRSEVSYSANNMNVYSSKFDSITYQSVIAPLAGDARDIRKGQLLGSNPGFSLLKTLKYEREKITQFNQGEKTSIYVRNYFSPIGSMSEIFTHFFNKFKNQINLIVNGKRR